MPLTTRSESEGMDTPDDLTMPLLLSAAFDSLVDAVQARLDGEGFPRHPCHPRIRHAGNR